MDLLFKRYASPFLLLDTYIKQARLTEFVSELYKIRDDEMAWETWLHKVYDQSFSDFKKMLNDTQRQNEASCKQIETTVKNTIDILKDFNPNEERD